MRLEFRNRNEHFSAGYASCHVEMIETRQAPFVGDLYRLVVIEIDEGHAKVTEHFTQTAGRDQLFGIPEESRSLDHHDVGHLPLPAQFKSRCHNHRVCVDRATLLKIDEVDFDNHAPTLEC